MDYSAFTEIQQQQYQQYQQQDQLHHQQPYGSAQAQAYDAYSASASASAYHHHQHQPQQYDASTAYHHYQYHPSDYSSTTAAASAAAYTTAQPDPALAAPLPAHDPSQMHAPQHHQHQHPHPGYGQEQQGGSGYEAPPELNPAAAAAVAALSQLTQFAGTMDAAERAMVGMQDRQWHGKGVGMTGGSHQLPPPQHRHYPPQLHRSMQHGPAPLRPAVSGRSPYRGGGRRGGGPFRGGGRGNFGHPPPRQDGAPPPSRGRGRGRIGRGGGRRSQQSAPDTQLPQAAPAPVVELFSVPEQAHAQAPAVVAASKIPRVPLLPIAWCDICRVDCNSPEILEQHKNGKRHKRTVQRFEEIQAQQRLMTELQAKVSVKPEMVLPKVEENKATPVGEPNKLSVASEKSPAELISAQVGEANKVFAASEKMLVPVLITEQKMEPEIQSQTEGQSEPTNTETAAELLAAKVLSSDAPITEAPPTEGGYRTRPRADGYDRYDRRLGPKRRMTKLTNGRGGKRLKRFEPVRSRPVERPREQPRYCTLCNVMCDTQAVFECHLSGKKHMSRIKRFQFPGAVFGPISVYIPPNQPTASQGPEPLFYGLKTHEMLQQEAYGLDGQQFEHFGQQQSGQPAQAREAEHAAPEFQAEQASEHLKEEAVPANGGKEAVTLDPVGKNASAEFEAKELTQEQLVLSTEAAMLDEAAFSIAEDVLPVPEFGASLDDNVVLPGLDVKVERLSANNEVGDGEAMVLP